MLSCIVGDVFIYFCEDLDLEINSKTKIFLISCYSWSIQAIPGRNLTFLEKRKYIQSKMHHLAQSNIWCVVEIFHVFLKGDITFKL